MDKITFLNYLEDELSRLPKTERDKIMYEYETKFFETQNEEELIHELDNPKAIAKKDICKYCYKRCRNGSEF